MRRRADASRFEEARAAPPVDLHEGTRHMSLPLGHDIKRIKFGDKGYAYIAARARLQGCTMQQAVREIVEERAQAEFHTATVLVSMVPREARAEDGEGLGVAARERGALVPFADLRRPAR